MTDLANYLGRISGLAAHLRCLGPRAVVRALFRVPARIIFFIVYACPLIVLEKSTGAISRFLHFVDARKKKEDKGLESEHEFIKNIKRTLLATGQNAEALRQCEEYLRKNPENGEIWCQLASLRFALGQPLDAYKALQTARECSRNPNVQYRCARMSIHFCAINNNMTSTTIRGMQEPVIALLNDISSGGEPFGFTERCLSNAIEYDAEAPDTKRLSNAYFLRGLLSLLSERPGPAELDIRKSIDIGVSSPFPHYYLAKVLEERGEVEAAIDTLKKGPGLGINHLHSLQMLTRLQLAAGDFESAMSSARSATCDGHAYHLFTAV